MLNCNSISNKLGEIKLLIYTEKPDVFCFSETWIKKYEPKFINYVSIWKHRMGFAGGLGILIRRGLQYRDLNLIPFIDGKLECQAVKVILENGKEISILNLYNPNKNITSDEFMHYIAQLGRTYVLVGDYNAHTLLLNSKCRRRNATGKALEEILLDDNVCIANPINMYTYIDSTTGKLSCLDLCLTSADVAPLTDVSVADDVGSDHRAIKIEIQMQPVRTKVILRQRYICKDKKKLLEFSKNIQMTIVYRPNDMETLTEDITDRIIHAADQTFKHTPSNQKEVPKKCTPWWNKETSDAVRERRKARRELEKNITSENLRNYKIKTNRARAICLNRKKKCFRDYISQLTYDSPSTEVWKKIRAIKANYACPTYPLKENNTLILDPVDKANKLLGTYAANSGNNAHGIIVNMEETIEESKIVESDNEMNLDFTMNELQYAIARIKNTTPGKDKIPNALIKVFPNYVLEELLYIYNQCYNSGNIPKIWKHSTIIPILKHGKPPEDCTSYRPISLLSCLGKLMERLVQRRLEYFAEYHRKLIGSQAGFRRGQGTLDILIRVENEIRKSITNKEICLVIYVDLKSAFDTIWGKGLTYKLCKMGIRGKMIRYMDNYFQERRYQVNLEGYSSETLEFEAGVPQGAVNSPLLFNLMLTDIPQQHDINLHIYADDITVTCIGNDIDEVKGRIQDYMDRFTKWSQDWGLQINPRKTVMQMYTRKRISVPIIKVNKQVVEYKKEQRLLGIIMDCPVLTWRPHIDYLVTDCIRRIDILKSLASTKWGANCKILRQFYIAYIRSKIDYGSVLYGSAAKYCLKKLDSVQNKAMRLILGARNTSPILSLEMECNLRSLQLRRTELTAVTYTKLMHRCCEDNTVGHLNMNVINKCIPAKSFHFRALEVMQDVEIKVRCTLTSQIYNSPYVNVSKYIVMEIDEHKLNSRLFEQYLSDTFPSYIQIYTDGSKIDNPEPSTACGLYLPHAKISVCWRLNPDHSVLCSELYAIKHALLYARKTEYRDFIILTDSLCSLFLISSCPGTYVEIATTIQNLLIELNKNRRVVLHWVRGHVGVRGNEVADRVANLGHKNNKSELLPLAREEILSKIKTKFKELQIQHWRSSAIEQRKGLFLLNIRDNADQDLIKEIRNRRMQVVISRLRIGHVGLNSYLNRFNMRDTSECQYCPIEETVEHFLLECPQYDGPRNVLINKLRCMNITNISIKVILSGDSTLSKKENRKILKYLCDFLVATGRVEEL